MLRKRSKPPARSLAFGLLAAALGSRGSFESAGGNERRRGRDLAMVERARHISEGSANQHDVDHSQ
jgi:hypothetical protein